MSMFLGFMVMDAPMNEDMNKIALNGGLALWAGFELMNLSERSKIACTIYGGAGCVLGLLDFFENIDGIKMILTHAGAQELMFLVVMAAMLVASLVGPVLALFVAHRPRVSLPQ